MTIEKDLATKMLKRLSRIKGFNVAFPFLIDELNKNNVMTWDNVGLAHDTDKADEEIINRLERRKLHVYAVLDNDFVVPGNYDEHVHMKSYLFLSDDPEDQLYDITAYDSDTFYAIADVYNDTWDINEMGSVLIAGGTASGPRRVC